MGGALLGMLAAAAVAATGLIVSSVLGVRRLAELLVAGYVVAFTDIVLLSLFLSLFDAMSRWGLVVGSVAILLAAVGILLLLGSRLPTPTANGSLRALVREGPLLVLAVVMALVVAYVVAIDLGTPPNGWDQLNYHLTRAALWLESENVGYVSAAYDGRINAYPPDAEIGLAFALSITRNEVFAATVQLVAALVCAVGIFALARRLELRRREAAFGALLFAALPIVLLQASSTKNDVVLASFLVAAAVFVLGDTRRELCVVTLATALAVGTKFTAFYALPLLLALAIVAVPGWALRIERFVAIGLGATAGLYWYAVNLIEDGRLLGDTSGIPGLTAILHPRENVLEGLGLTVDWIDLSGAKGADLFLYPVAGLLVGGGLAYVPRRKGWGTRWPSAAAAGALVASPILLYVLTTYVGRPALVGLYHLLGDPTAYLPGGDDPNSSPTQASETGSWFGPVGLLLTVGVGVAATILVRRGSLPRTALVCTVAPLAWTVLVALSLTYHPWQGRFFLFPVALSASLWGLTLRAPPVAWATAALSAVTAVLVLVHYSEKPSGLRILDREQVTSVWELARSQVQSQHDPAVGPVFRFLDDEVPAHDSIALALGVNDFGFPAFGPRLERGVQLVPFGSSAREIDSQWLLANAERAGEVDEACWVAKFRSDAATVFKRRPACNA